MALWANGGVRWCMTWPNPCIGVGYSFTAGDLVRVIPVYIGILPILLYSPVWYCIGYYSMVWGTILYYRVLLLLYRGAHPILSHPNRTLSTGVGDLRR